MDHTQHPDAATRSIVDIEEQIFDSCIAKGVLVVRGSWFRAEREKDVSGLYFRATYAMATDADMVEAIKRFGAAVRESFGITE